MSRSFIIIFLLIASSIFAQSDFSASESADSIKTYNSIVKKVQNFRFHPDNMDTFGITPDTLLPNMIIYNPAFRESFSNNYLGNLGTPYISNIYFHRPLENDFYFQDVYRAYMWLPVDLEFIDTRTPYTNLGYGNGGPTNNGEEYVSVLHSRNITPELNITGFGDYILGRGIFKNQKTNHLKISLRGSYITQKYRLFTAIGFNKMDNEESGGITNDDLLLNPATNTPSQRASFGTKLSNAHSVYNNNFIDIKQRYSLGYNKISEGKDSAKTFVPVTFFTHNFSISTHEKKYEELGVNSSFYGAPLLFSDKTFDRAFESKITNRFGIYLNEGLNKYTPWGLGVYIENDIIGINNNPWYSMNDSLLGRTYSSFESNRGKVVADSITYDFINNYNKENLYNLMWGAQLFSRKGKYFKFESEGQIYFAGYRAGDYSLQGGITINLPILDTVSLKANIDLKRITPDYFNNHYYSNHFWWNNDFNATYLNRIRGMLTVPAINTTLSFGTSAITNPIYFDTLALPRQIQNTILILHVGFENQMSLGPLHWDNKIVFQQSSNKNIVPLPEIAVNSDLYLQGKYARVLKFRIGADMRYHTAYYAQEYMPATGRFYNQNNTLIGNYPLLRAYANFHLKRTRFFLMYYNVAEGLISNNYFGSPHYPLNPRILKMGISWNFYD